MSAIIDADWVIRAIQETPDTEGYFEVEEFAAMRTTAKFINVGRGNSVNEAALLAALAKKRIARRSANAGKMVNTRSSVRDRAALALGI